MLCAQPRRKVSPRLRFEVFQRDGHACRYCGGRPPGARLEIDHFLPVAEGGGNERENLVTSCFDCNRGKAALKLALLPRGLDDAEARLRRLEAATGAVTDELFPGAAHARLSRDWLRAIARFNQRLPLHAVRAAAGLARGRVRKGRHRRFLYFCKVCWNRIREDGE